jgi:O-antigen/teichoic acid export membrane protein
MMGWLSSANLSLGRHGRALVGVGVVSAGGIIATVGFQVLTGRFLGPEAYGLLAAFMAIVSIGATGSAALQNSVAVGSAAARQRFALDPGIVQGRDHSLTEAFTLGGIGTAAVIVASPVLADFLNTSALSIILAGATILPAFLLSRALGIIQGSGASQSVAGWTTGGQVLRLALAVIVIFLSLGAISMLLAIVISTVVITVGAAIHARAKRVRPLGRAFTPDTVVVLLLTVGFAWLTSIDVVLVRGGTSEIVSGSFAAAAMLTKTIFLIPGMLSVYLLPRFVSRRDDARASLVGVLVTMATIGLCGVLAFFAILAIGGPIVSLLFGDGYSLTATYLPWMALAYLPWALAQGLLIRLSAAASQPALVVLAAGIVAQWAGAAAVLPDVFALVAVIGGIGCVIFIALAIINFCFLKPRPSLKDTHEVA